MSSNNCKGYSRKGVALYFLKDFDNSLLAYQKGLEIEPSNTVLQEGVQQVKTKVEAMDANEKGEELQGKNKLPEAISCFDKAISLDPKEAFFYANRSEAHLKNGDFAKALADADQAVCLVLVR
jgi:tetratricopeptide (TPR) repeat protein